MNCLVYQMQLNGVQDARQDILLRALTTRCDASGLVAINPLGTIEENEISIIIGEKSMSNRPLPYLLPRILIMPTPAFLPAHSYFKIKQGVETVGIRSIENLRYAMHAETIAEAGGRAGNYRPYALVWRHVFSKDELHSEQNAEVPGGGIFEIFDMFSVLLFKDREKGFIPSDGAGLVNVNMQDSGGWLYSTRPLPTSHFFPNILEDGLGAPLRSIPHPTCAPATITRTALTSVDLGDTIAENMEKAYLYLIALGRIEENV